MSLVGKSFVISGTLSAPRSTIISLIIDNGGYVNASVTKQTNFLIVSDPNISTTKVEAARKKNITVISEDGLKSLIAGSESLPDKPVKPVNEQNPSPAKAAKVEPIQTKLLFDGSGPLKVASSSLPLSGMTIAISGKLSLSKEEVADIITANGGTYANTVTKKCTHVIARDMDAASSKLQKARTLGASIVDETFLEGMKGASDDTVAREKSTTKAPPGVLLAQKYEPKSFPNGPIDWWVSEKLDGVRCYWDGAEILSRVGNKFHAPEWFLDRLPKDHHLDGELFIGRGMFKEVVSVVKSHEAGDRWKDVIFMVFDVPSSGERPFEERMALMNDLCKNVLQLQMVEQKQFKAGDSIDEMLKKVEDMKGEGLMLRKPNSTYIKKRSNTLLKVKTFFDDEAKVIGFATEGTGRLTGMTGSLRCITRKGVEFDCGSGMDDALRHNPPPIGSIITFRYQEISDTSGKPRFPTFVGIAIDKTFP